VECQITNHHHHQDYVTHSCLPSSNSWTCELH